MKIITILAILAITGCATVDTHVATEQMDKIECESRCATLGYEVREVRDGNCICNLSRCRHMGGCEPLPPPPPAK